MDVPDIITCIDCGQPAHRLTLPPEDGWEPGDIVAYRCSGCMDRWDLVVEDGAEEPERENQWADEIRAILARRPTHAPGE